MPANTKLRDARLSAKLTQLQLAEECGLTEIKISRFETGRQRPLAGEMDLISGVLKRPVKKLVME